MPPKKKGDAKDDLGFMRAARFGRVKNTLSMGFGMYLYECVCVCVYEIATCSKAVLLKLQLQ